MSLRKTPHDSEVVSTFPPPSVYTNSTHEDLQHIARHVEDFLLSAKARPNYSGLSIPDLKLLANSVRVPPREGAAVWPVRTKKNLKADDAASDDTGE